MVSLSRAISLSVALNACLLVALVSLSLRNGATQHLGTAQVKSVKPSTACGRRGFFGKAAMGVALPVIANIARPRDSYALKFPGDKPKDIGVRGDGSLKGCPSTSNCWSTFATDDKHVSAAFTYDKPKEEAIQDLTQVLNAYPKDGLKIDEKTLVDGGGWRMMKIEDGYIYLEYESKKFGFIDDVEFFVQDGKIQYRSASRLGDSDLGVNAYRLNFIANELKKKGFSTPGFPLTTVAQR